MSLQEKVRKTSEAQDTNYDEWNIQQELEKFIVKLTVSYDVGWQKRSSGNKFDSLSSHAFMIGSRTRKITNCVVNSKMCATCIECELRNVEHKQHNCPQRTTMAAPREWKLMQHLRAMWISTGCQFPTTIPPCAPCCATRQ